MESQKAWNPLTEKEKLEIIKLAESPSIYHQWKFIGESIQRSLETCKKFYNSYSANGTIFPKLRRPPKVNDSIKQSVVDSMIRDSTQSLEDFSTPNGVGLRCFRTRLLFFDKHVNSQNYMKTLLGNDVFGHIEKIFCQALAKLRRYSAAKQCSIT